MLALISTLALLLGSVAALGVFNTVVVTVGLIGGALAVPLGWGVHRWIVPVMFDAAGFGYPPEFLSVFGPWQLVALGAIGIVLAVLGALIPAGWAARTRVATALRAE